MKHTNELYISVPVDIDTVKSKFLFGLTLRQIICFGIGIGLGLTVYFLCKGLFGDSIAGILMMFIMLPAFFFAVYEQNGEDWISLSAEYGRRKRNRRTEYIAQRIEVNEDKHFRTARRYPCKDSEETGTEAISTADVAA